MVTPNVSNTEPFRWVIAAMWFAIYFFSSLAFFCMPPLFAEISRDIPLTKVQMGIIFGMNPLASLFLAFIAGSISDRFGSRWVVGAAFLLITVAGGLRATSHSVLDLIIFAFLMGVGTAFFGPNVPKVLGTWFPKEELGKANGFVMTAIPLGGAAAIASSASILSPAFGGWRGVMVACAVICLVVTVLWMILYREKEIDGVDGKQTQAFSSNFKNVLKVKDIWLLAIFFGFYLAACGTVTGLLPVILTEKGVNRPGEIVSLFMWIGIVSTPLGGIAIDKFDRRKPFLIVGAIVMAAVYPLLVITQGAGLIIALLVLGMAAGIIVPLKTLLPVEIEGIGPRLAATAFGFMMMLGFAMGFLGPTISGKIMDVTGSALPAFIMMAVCMLVAACIAIPMKETGKQTNTGN
ncbi:MAG: MFS transporter [Deltaproteobacteria bacterium]|nr:MFS transporter [Deltaproteobacteria bacterium]